MTVEQTSFERCVFINCPFDRDYEPILQAVLFCIIYLGLIPRLATETQDSGDIRVSKIIDMIQRSKYSIHDLSRCQAKEVGEHYRLNMPFELGIDYGCKKFFGNGRDKKKILILEEEKYRYQAAISDLAGCDIQAHTGKYYIAMRSVRNWLATEADLPQRAPGPSKIDGAYIDFQEWHYERQLAEGFSDDDIQEYPTAELLSAMKEWVKVAQVNPH